MSGHFAASHIFKYGDHFVQDLRLNAGLSTHAHGIVHYNDGEDQGDGKFKTAGAILVADCGGQSTYGSGMGTGHAATSHQPFCHEFLGDDQMDDGLQNLGDQPATGGRQENCITEKLFKKSHK